MAGWGTDLDRGGGAELSPSFRPRQVKISAGTYAGFEVPEMRSPAFGRKHRKKRGLADGDFEVHW